MFASFTAELVLITEIYSCFTDQFNDNIVDRYKNRSFSR